MERKEAKMLGLKTYMTGKPCKSGHLTYRYTSTGSCNQCINGIRNGGNSETFSKRANDLRMTALSTYNEALKSITAQYEYALASADKLDSRAAELRAIEEENNHKRLVHELKLTSMKIEAEKQQIRKEAVKRMVKLNVFIHPHDVVNAKEWLLEKAREVCPEITMQDINYRNKVQGGVLHEIRCFAEHQALILEETNKVYATPQSSD